MNWWNCGKCGHRMHASWTPSKQPRPCPDCDCVDYQAAGAVAETRDLVVIDRAVLALRNGTQPTAVLHQLAAAAGYDLEQVA